MRFAKGSISISDEHDVPLLLLVRNSQYISQAQLMTLAGYGMSQASAGNFRWRMSRLVRGGYVEVLDQRVSGSRVYTITHLGLERLELIGHQLLSVHSLMPNIHHPLRMMHALDLADMRISLTASANITKWETDVEVCSENMRTGEKYVKDYDAAAHVAIDGAVLVCAIEYERMPKSASRYARIGRTLRDERLVDTIIYVVGEVEHVPVVSERLAGVHRCILFTPVSAFRKAGLNAYALRSATEGAPIKNFLRCIAARPASAA
jgi:DNA-binding PadR family transcriptional regulator